MRIRQAAELLGVSDDTVRRWIDNGTLPASQDQAGRKVIAGDVLAEFWRANAPSPPPNPLGINSSARNRFVGLVTDVLSDKVMTRVEMQCGPHTVVSLMSTEAARELEARARQSGRRRCQSHHGDRRDPAGAGGAVRALSH